MTTTNNNPIIRRRSDPLPRHTGYIPCSLQDDTSLAKLPEERRVEDLLSHDGVTAGNESGVALLPDKRKQLEFKAGPLSTQALDNGASTDASIWTLPGSRQDAADSRPHDAASSSKSHSVHSRKGEEASGNGRAIERSPNPENPSHAVGTVVGALTDSSGQSHPRKLGFMDKVKGEIKILSGKMSHNESKIEEGRKMMGKN